MLEANKLPPDIARLVIDEARRRNIAPEQLLAHWITLGRDAERHVDHPPPRSEGIEVRELSFDEQDAFFAEFDRLTSTGAAFADAYWADRRARGVGVGALDDGSLIQALPGGQFQRLAT